MLKLVLQSEIDRLYRGWRGAGFEVVLWNGDRLRAGSAKPELTMTFKTPGSLLRSIFSTSLGLGEAYVHGEFTVDGDLEDALAALAPLYLRLDRDPPVRTFLSKLIGRTLVREKNDVEHHYGISNDFYAYYLDSKLQYSCGYFRTPEDTLDDAQDQKIAHTVRKLNLQRGQRLLDIGCGWGHLMFHAAAQYGVECVGLTLCDNQAAYIREQARLRNLPVEVRVMNYLELDERRKWDRIVSVGMMCHVGEHNADRFYDKLEALAAPEAVVLTHCISKMKEASGHDPFVEKYVFPGYWFFSLEGETERAIERGFNIVDVENLRRHYLMTLRHWRRNFNARYHEIQKRFGFDQAFMRTWEFYLASAAAGFRSGYLNLIQMVMTYGKNDAYPMTREHLYADLDPPRAVTSVGAPARPRDPAHHPEAQLS